MALTNIELYEALKKDLSEDSARMIAEVVPKADDIATKSDLLALRHDFLSMEQRLDRRITALERRFYLVIGVPLWGGSMAAVVKYLFS